MIYFGLIFFHHKNLAFRQGCVNFLYPLYISANGGLLVNTNDKCVDISNRVVRSDHRGPLLTVALHKLRFVSPFHTTQRTQSSKSGWMVIDMLRLYIFMMCPQQLIKSVREELGVEMTLRVTTTIRLRLFLTMTEEPAVVDSKLSLISISK